MRENVDSEKRPVAGLCFFVQKKQSEYMFLNSPDILRSEKEINVLQGGTHDRDARKK